MVAAAKHDHAIAVNDFFSLTCAVRIFICRKECIHRLLVHYMLRQIINNMYRIHNFLMPMFFFDVQVNFFIGAFYDGVYLLGLVLNETLTEGGDIRDGINLTRKMWNRDFVGECASLLNFFFQGCDFFSIWSMRAQLRKCRERKLNSWYILFMNYDPSPNP